MELFDTFLDIPFAEHPFFDGLFVPGTKLSAFVKYAYGSRNERVSNVDHNVVLDRPFLCKQKLYRFNNDEGSLIF